MRMGKTEQISTKHNNNNSDVDVEKNVRQVRWNIEMSIRFSGISLQNFIRFRVALLIYRQELDLHASV